MTSRLRQRLRSVAAFGVLVALVVCVPVLLIAVAGWPLPSTVPDWEQVRVALVQGDLPAGTVVKGIAVVVWLIWFQLAWAVIWEVAVNVTRVEHGEQPRRAPLVTSFVHVGVGRLVAIAFSIGFVTVTTPTPVLAHPVTYVAPAEPTMSPLVAEPASEFAEVGWSVHQNDSLWRIAEVALGDGSRATEILDLNPMLGSPRNLQPGQVLRLPADAVVPADRQPAAQSKAPPPESRFVPAIDVVVQPGDNLWNLSSDRIAEAHGVEATDGDVVEYLEIVIEANLDVIEDPNLIYPGEVFEFPSIGTPPAAEPEPPVVAPPDVIVAPSLVDNRVVLAPIVDAAPALTEPVVAPRPSIAPSADSTADLDLVDGHSPTQAAAPIIAGITGATTLATGLLLAYRRRRVRQAARGAHAYQAAGTSDPQLERAMVAAADLPLLQWLNHELASAFGQIDPRRTSATPLALEVSETHGIELLWNEPNPHAPHPWEATDGARVWRLVYDPDLPVPVSSVPPPLPGLVTVGTRDGRQLLVDLEALGTVSINGPEPGRSEFVRSILTELATNDSCADAYVHVVHSSVVDLILTGRTVEQSPAEALRVIQSTVAEHDKVLSSAGLATTFALRAGGDSLGREVTVAVTSDDELGAASASLAQPHRGVAVVALGAVPPPGSFTINLDEGGVARLDPIGITFQPVALPAESAERYNDLLELADEVDESEECDEQFPTPVRLPVNESSMIDGEEEPPADDLDAIENEFARPAAPDVLVRVLGTPAVVNYPSLGRLETSIVAFLACSGGSSTDDQLIDAVWNGRMVERTTVWNRIAKARKVLGDFLPARDPGANKLRLDPGVRTDLDYVLELVDLARTASTTEAIDLLTDALDLVDGVPFNAAGYDWAHQHQHFAQAIDAIEAAALHLVELALDANDVATARHAVTTGLRALPANEPLYRARMRIEHAANNIPGVEGAYSELVSQLNELADGIEYDPSPSTVSLYSELRRSVSYSA